jgi:hypothetical protein
MQMTLPSGMLQLWIRFVSIAVGTGLLLLLVYIGEQIVYLLVSLSSDIDCGCLAGMWHYLDGEYLLLFAYTEKPLTCLVLDL